MRRIISHPLFVGTISALVVKFLPDIFGKNWVTIMEFLYNHLWIGVWPIWVGLAIATIYCLIKFSINVYKAYIDYDTFVKKTYDSFKEIKEDLKKEIADRKGAEDGIIEGILSREDMIRKEVNKEISKWREVLAGEISDLRETTTREDYEFRLSINKLILQDTDFEERVNHILYQRIVTEKQEAIWERERQERKIAGIPDWDKWPNKEK